jgi:lysine 2,3-aminomutase
MTLPAAASLQHGEMAADEPAEPPGIEPTRSSRPTRLEVLKSAFSPKVASFRARYFPEITDLQWHDWQWQAANRFRSVADFQRVLTLSHSERAAIERGGSTLPVAVTPYYMSLLDAADADQALRRTVIPELGEFLRTPGEADDPLGEDGHSPVPGIVHRYPDRVLFLALDYCTTYCRYCTRSRVVGSGELSAGQARLERAIDYIRRTPAIRDVLISGGDPLSLKEHKLDWILTKLREIPHLEFIRIGTKMPAVLPQRITPELIAVLRKHHPIWMSIHFIHPDECTPEAYAACALLADAGIPLGAQAVLLKGVNDDEVTLRELTHRLLLMRVRPYYLYQCDPVSGSSHFRTPVERGVDLMKSLRGHTTGYGSWTYVVDAPGGGGKIPLAPNYVEARDEEGWTLRNFEGETYRYVDPAPSSRTASARVHLPTLRDAGE